MVIPDGSFPLHVCGMTIATPTRPRVGSVRLATAADHEAIHRLNYRTFVEEIPQHDRNDEQRLVDRFHADNCYVVYEVEGEIVGMVAARTQRPFSLDEKLGAVDEFLPPFSRVAELRLLAVERRYRTGRVFASLVRFLAEHLSRQGFDLGVISGTTRQLRLYEHMGFTPFGRLVGREGAWYQPMFITLERLDDWSPVLRRTGHTNFLPGPVDVTPKVQHEFASAAVSHRSQQFGALHEQVTHALCSLTNARHATLLMGSGTLANDVVAGQLREHGGRGLILVNGEFGERLVDHAARWGLQFDIARAGWGQAFDIDVLDQQLADRAHRWLWMVHCETSTGVLNDLPRIVACAQAHRVRVAVDAISSVGSVPVDLSAVWLATAVSGKALGAFAGVSAVLHDAEVSPSSRLPRYMDLGYAREKHGVPFTQSSNLVRALSVALGQRDWPRRYDTIAHDSARLRRALAEQQFQLVADPMIASPAVHTIVLPHHVSSHSVGRQLRSSGWLVSFQSDYLAARNWIQVCLMGEYAHDDVERFPRELRMTCDRRSEGAELE